MDNLVERLRRCEKHGKRHVGELCGEAASEIERLEQQQLADAKAFLKKQAQCASKGREIERLQDALLEFTRLASIQINYPEQYRKAMAALAAKEE